MCGICGKVNLDTARPIASAEIEAMSDTMIRRGPDAGGVHLDRHAGLGHRRLSIIDLAASVQPMPNEDGTVWIAFNGEIYNFQELRQELIGRGHRFRTAGDTETIVHAYEEFGADCVTRLRGHVQPCHLGRPDRYAAARARSHRDQAALLHPDRSGVPLRVGAEGAGRRRAFSRRTRQIDEEAVHSYLSFLSVPDPISIYRGVRKLPAGHVLTLRRGQVALHRYWNVSFRGHGGSARRGVVRACARRAAGGGEDPHRR